MLSTNDLHINVASRTSKMTIKLNIAAGRYIINSGFFWQHISARLPSFLSWMCLKYHRNAGSAHWLSIGSSISHLPNALLPISSTRSIRGDLRWIDEFSWAAHFPP